MVMVAGSVINEPSRGPMVRMTSHQAAGVDPARAATLARHPSAKRNTGRELAIAITTTTKTASAGSAVAASPVRVFQPFIVTMARASGISQIPNTASTLPRKWKSRP
jgi:hypothetical protein